MTRYYTEEQVSDAIREAIRSSYHIYAPLDEYGVTINSVNTAIMGELIQNHKPLTIAFNIDINADPKEIGEKIGEMLLDKMHKISSSY